MKEEIIKVLRSLVREEELQLYLRIFQKTPSHKFAVIKIGGDSLSKKLPIIVEDLVILSKLGLYPIVVHGGGKPIDLALEKKSISVKKVNNLRVTDKQTIAVVKDVLTGITDKLVASIKKRGGSAINVNDLGIIRIKKKSLVDGVDLGFVGDVTDVEISKLRDLCKKGVIPVFASIGYIGDNAYNINADTLANEIVKKLIPKKFILITETGGILDKNGKLISAIDTQTDLPCLIKEKVITEGMLLKVKEIKQLLEKAPGTVVEICSAENLLTELFTVKGSGTFVRCGANFVIQNNFKGLNLNKIKKMLEKSFEKELVTDYFKQPADLIILEKNYSGIAVIKKLKKHYYLDKFAVAKSAQGNGLGKTLWHVIKNKYPSFIWRSSMDNPINNWYFKKCDGGQKSGKWIVFWHNIAYSKLSKLIPVISDLPPTMVKK